VTPKGTRPGQAGQLPRAGAAPLGTGSSTSSSASAGVSASSRYTPPVPRSLKESPKWVPVLMCVFLIVGVLTILVRYLLADDIGNWVVFAGLGFILAGLYTATRWH
jgi:hypothetical protein